MTQEYLNKKQIGVGRFAILLYGLAILVAFCPTMSAQEPETIEYRRWLLRLPSLPGRGLGRLD